MSAQPLNKTKPRIFIGSSSGAGLDIAREIHKELLDVGEPKIWNKHEWLGKGTLEQLMNILDESDFGVFVFRPDDILEIRDEKTKAPRDNVLLELGMFYGRHGRDKTFIVVQDIQNLRIATDLLGINFALFSSNSPAQLEAACYDIRKRIRDVWKAEQVKKSATGVLTYEARMLYRILNAASSPQYKAIESDVVTPFPRGDESFANIQDVRVIAEELFYYYMYPHLQAAQNEAQRMRVYFAYYLGDGVPFDDGPEPSYCLGRDDDGKEVKGAFVIGISISDKSIEPKWMSGLPLKGYDPSTGKALSNAAHAFRTVNSSPIDDTDNPAPNFRNLNFKVNDEKAVYSVPVVLSDKRWNKRETVAPIGILTISGSHPNMLNVNIKKRADQLAILLGFIFYLHVKQNPDVPRLGKEFDLNKLPIGFIRGNSPDFSEFVRRGLSLRREVAKHFEEYFLQQGIHKLENNELSYVPAES